MPIIFLILIAAAVIPLMIDNSRLKERIKNLEENKVIVYDTSYNHIVLDSINYHIIHKDSIIINYKTKIEYEIQQSNNCSDSDAIKLFYRLLSE